MQKSQHYLFMEALVRRIYENDAEAAVFHEEFYRLQAGLSGEMKLKNQLADYPFKSEHCILYNLECINERGFSHQIDALLITPHFVLLLEVKQISGQLFYKQAVHEFSRKTSNGLEENLRNPFDQIFRHKLFIEEVLRQHQLSIPVLNLVVISNYRARIDTSLEKMPILHLSGLPAHLENLYQLYPPTPISPFAIQDIFLKLKQPLPARRQITKDRLKPGIFCTNCDSKQAMYYHHGYWHCLDCKAKSITVLLDALSDYRLLISERLSNRTFRQYTGMNCRHAAGRILQKLNLQKTGYSRSVIYIIPEEIKWIK